MVRCYEPEHTGGFCQTFKFSVRTWGEIGLCHCSRDIIVAHPTHSFFISFKFSSQEVTSLFSATHSQGQWLGFVNKTETGLNQTRTP